MLTSKQRAFLRAMANGEDAIVHIGKGGVSENVAAQTAEALKARELVKCRVLENSLLDTRAVCDELAEMTGADPVQVIGTKFVLYKANTEAPKIKLPKK